MSPLTKDLASPLVWQNYGAWKSWFFFIVSPSSWLFPNHWGKAEPSRLLNPSVLQKSKQIMVDELSPIQVSPYDVLLSKNWLKALYMIEVFLSRDRPPTIYLMNSPLFFPIEMTLSFSASLMIHWWATCDDRQWAFSVTFDQPKGEEDKFPFPYEESGEGEEKKMVVSFLGPCFEL